MGPSPSKEREFDREISHPRFNKSKIVTRENTQYLQTTLPIDEKQYQKWKNALTVYSQPPQYLLLPVSHSFERGGFCGNAGTTTINYHNYPYLLSDQIQNRHGKKTKFHEPEMWLLLHCLLQARFQAQQHGQQLGDIRPRNVFLNQEANIKVANSLSWPQEQSNIQKTLDKTNTYIAPEDLSKLGRGEFFDNPSSSAEAFSIGLCALSAANLQQYQETLYDIKNYAFKEQVYEQAISSLAFNRGYSEVLRGVILALVNLDIERRLPCDDLRVMLEKHSEKVIAKQNFVVDNAPPKLHYQIQNLRQQLNPPPRPMSVPIPASSPLSYGQPFSGVPASYSLPFSGLPARPVSTSGVVKIETSGNKIDQSGGSKIEKTSGFKVDIPSASKINGGSNIDKPVEKVTGIVPLNKQSPNSKTKVESPKKTSPQKIAIQQSPNKQSPNKAQ